MKMIQHKGKILSILALTMIGSFALMQPAKADNWHDDHGRGRGPNWHARHEWEERRWHRPRVVYQPRVVYAPPPVVYAPQPSPGINLILPLHFD
jgi:hypothetical protein